MNKNYLTKKNKRLTHNFSAGKIYRYQKRFEGFLRNNSTIDSDGYIVLKRNSKRKIRYSTEEGD